MSVEGNGKDTRTEEPVPSVKDLRSRDAILGALAAATTRCLHMTSSEQAVREMLRRLGEATQVSRVYMFQNHLGEDGTPLTSQRFEWVAPGIEPQLGNPALQSACWEAMGVTRWVEVMSRGDTIRGHVKDFPLSEQPVLDSQNIQSIVAMPIFVEKDWWGFIGFDECSAEREWSQAEMEALNASAGILGGLLQRTRLEEELRVHQEKLEVLVEERTEELRDSNRRLREEISSRKRTEDALRESQERYRSFFDEAPMALWEIDASYVKSFADEMRGRGVTDLREYFVQNPEEALRCERKVKLLEMNNASLRMLEANTKEEILEDLARLIPKSTSPPFSTGILAVAEGRIFFEREVASMTVKGKPKHILYKWSVLPGYEKTYSRILVSLMDITDRVQLEQELLRSQKLESLGVLAGGIAHDFNNLLTAIWTNISMVKMYGEFEDDVSEMLGDAEKACSRAKGLTHQLLAFAKGGKPIKKTVSVVRLMKDAAEFALSGSRVQSEYSLPEDPWPVSADEGQIGQVIHNLVINADQAMPGGGRIRVSANNVLVEENDKIPLKEGRYVNVTVTDEGVGIPRQHLDRVFDPFFTTKQKGSGLGLTTCFTIVRNHGGHIRVRSEVERGTTVEVYLPASEESLAGQEKETEGRTRGDGRVLLVDDEEMIRRSAGEMLRRSGYEVAVASDGEEGLERYRQAQDAGRPFDVVIMDLTIRGGRGGKEIVRELMGMDPDAKVVISSGYSDDPVMSDFGEYGFVGVVEKPYKIEDLAVALKKAVAKGC